MPKLKMDEEELRQMEMKHLGRMLKMGFKGKDYEKIYRVYMEKKDPELYQMLKDSGQL